MKNYLLRTDGGHQTVPPAAPGQPFGFREVSSYSAILSERTTGSGSGTIIDIEARRLLPAVGSQVAESLAVLAGLQLAAHHVSGFATNLLVISDNQGLVQSLNTHRRSKSERKGLPLGPGPKTLQAIRTLLEENPRLLVTFRWERRSNNHQADGYARAALNGQEIIGGSRPEGTFPPLPFSRGVLPHEIPASELSTFASPQASNDDTPIVDDLPIDQIVYSDPPRHLRRAEVVSPAPQAREMFATKLMLQCGRTGCSATVLGEVITDDTAQAVTDTLISTARYRGWFIETDTGLSRCKDHH